MKKRKPNKATIIRTAAFFIAVINEVCAWRGWHLLPISSEDVAQIVNDLALIVTGIIAWWKDNAFTQIAIYHNERMLADKKREKISRRLYKD